MSAFLPAFVTRRRVDRYGQPAAPAERPPGSRQRRDGYFVQIGLDFGTAFLKCVCRDVAQDEAWVYTSSRRGGDTPFLIPASVRLDGRRLALTAADDPDVLQSPKTMLRDAALGRWHGPALSSLAQRLGTTERRALEIGAKVVGVYLLAQTLAGVRRCIRGRLPGFGEHIDDYVAVNMAIPVADAERPEINRAFEEVLRAAWMASKTMAHGAASNVRSVEAWLVAAASGSGEADECFVYPEVSANVQAFVRSRVSREGTYVFCDTGASTVDLSVFIFCRLGGGDRLTYLHAAVLPLGSSEIELRASARCGEDIAALRRLKEANAQHPVLDLVRREIQQQVTQETKRTLAWARKKFYYPQQIERARVIFGGGGHARVPYEVGVLRAFRTEIFSREIRPEHVEMPIPHDLELAPGNRGWMRRLSVAYGLSFDRGQLTPFVYPRDVEPPRPDEIWQPMRPRVHAPTKDEV